MTEAHISSVGLCMAWACAYQYTYAHTRIENVPYVRRSAHTRMHVDVRTRQVHTYTHLSQGHVERLDASSRWRAQRAFDTY